MTAAPAVADVEVPLPPLRAELQILSQTERGAHGAVVFDPIRARYFRISEETAQLLSLWPRCRTAGDLAALAAARFGLALAEAQVAELVQFLAGNELTVPVQEGDWRRLLAAERRAEHGWLAWSLHNYLFLRIPLIAPEPILRRLAPWLEPLFTRTAAILVALAGTLGLYLVSRQWDAFAATFPHFFSLTGAAVIALALGAVKSLHELGHAATAYRYGCRVPSMGICFVVLTPMLYTDVTDAWRLASRRRRAAIDAAGMIVELSVACLATLAWAFLPEGPARSIAFVLATTSWLMSVAINLNPFARFDGYYLLSDIMGIENLQSRSFALGRWVMREALLGVAEPPPERLPRATVHWMVAFAWGTWIYRLILFTGIALLVYHMAFKLLGVFLFLVEIVYFIAWPIWREIREWHNMRQRLITSPRALLTFTVLAAMLGLSLVPWSTRVTVPAVVESAELQHAFPKRAAVVIETAVRRGDTVPRGGLIVSLSSPELDQDIRLTAERIKLLEWRLARQAGDSQDRADTIVLKDELRSQRTRLEGLETEKAELRIRSSIDGTIAELDPDLHPGRWVGRQDLVALVRGSGPGVVQGYVAEADVARIDASTPAVFIPEDPLGSAYSTTVDSIESVGATALAALELSSHYGGAIAARVQPRPGESRQHLPVTGQFLVRAHTTDAPVPTRTLRGTLLAAGRPESLAARAFRQILKVAVREAGL